MHTNDETSSESMLHRIRGAAGKRDGLAAETNVVRMPSRLDTLTVMRLYRGDLQREFRHLRPGEIRLTHFGMTETLRGYQVVIFEDPPFTILLKNNVGFTGFVGGRAFGAPFMCRKFVLGDYCGGDARYINEAGLPLCETCAAGIDSSKLQVIDYE